MVVQRCLIVEANFFGKFALASSFELSKLTPNEVRFAVILFEMAYQFDLQVLQTDGSIVAFIGQGQPKEDIDKYWLLQFLSVMFSGLKM